MKTQPGLIALRNACIAQARELTAFTGRKHVVRDTGAPGMRRYIVCPLFEPGREGCMHDAGYAALGLLVAESIQ